MLLYLSFNSIFLFILCLPLLTYHYFHPFFHFYANSCLIFALLVLPHLLAQDLKVLSFILFS